MNWERVKIKKNKLKKYLNWLNSTKGMKVAKLYFWLFSLLLGKVVGSV